MEPALPVKLMDEGQEMTTWFASAHRAEKEELARQIDFITQNPLVSVLLSSVSGLIAVLNEDRQILAVNDNFLSALGIDDPAGSLGLRPGEVLQCVHSHDNHAGCGTGKFCSTCGAVIAITASLSTSSPVEQKCIMTVSIDNDFTDLCFMVKASPLDLEGNRFVLVFIQDITEQERRVSLERTFLHDIKNTVMGLDCTVELISRSQGDRSSQLHKRLRRLSDSLVRDVKTQSSIARNSYQDLSGEIVSATIQQVTEEISDIISNHPAAAGKTLTISKPSQHIDFSTDLPLLIKILVNMLINALEATMDGKEVRFWIEKEEANIVFRVWNQCSIPEAVTMRIFQRFFSTKPEPGRGLGTYSMKYFGEKVLGGNVNFTTSADDGTVFTFSLPI